MRRDGRPAKVDDADAAKLRLREKGITATDIAKMRGASRAPAYRYLDDSQCDSERLVISRFRLCNHDGAGRLTQPDAAQRSPDAGVGS